LSNVLVTGGAGFIGSHSVDLLVAEGHRVRILDNLERPTHMTGAPQHLNPRAEFIRGDVRNIDDLARALWGMDSVLHLAATGGFTPDIAKYFDTNSIGTANLLELVQQQNFRVRRIVVASSVGVYGEGAYSCPTCGPRDGAPRSLEQLNAGRWEMRCPDCGLEMEPQATSEAKTPAPAKAYSISKFDQERLVLGFGRDFGITTCALRYFLTYGPRQSLTNPYTGVISNFASRILNGHPPILFEDGHQTRDFAHVADVARANLLALQSDQVSGGVFNVGTGVATPIQEIARLLAQILGRSDVEPELPGEFRPGESRHIFADVSRLQQIGFEASVSLKEGLEDYVSWLRGVGEVDEYLSGALAGLRRGGVVRSMAEGEAESPEDSLSIVIPVYNEAGNLESIVRHTLAEVGKFVDDFEILIVNDGSHDGTGVIADDLAGEDARVRVFHHPFNVGYGGAQKSGFRNATKSWVVVVPADHQFDVRDLARFMEARRSADIIGSFRVGRRDPLQRRLISRLYNLYLQRFHGVKLRDANWVKMFRREIFDHLEIESSGFGVDAEIVVKARVLDRTIIEIPVDHYPRTWGNATGVSVTNLTRTARELLRIKGMIRRMQARDDEPSDAVGSGPASA
jgi:dTDP-L-rhamnose 4-epimerase